MPVGVFSIYQFSVTGKCERLAAFIDCGSAVSKAHVHRCNLAAQMGVTRRIIVTDGDDHTVWEWRWGKGVVFPTV